jgi:hypothetical protein
MLACPNCGATTLKAYFLKRYTCSDCRTDLASNIGVVTMWEGVIGLFTLWLPRMLLAQLFGSAWYVDWAILLPVMLIAHFAVLNALVELVPAGSK